nr:MAG TPA: hypothetical protein [Caudoviricetes sp.]
MLSAIFLLKPFALFFGGFNHIEKVFWLFGFFLGK